MPGRLLMTVICLHISAVLYVLLGLGFLLIFLNLPPEQTVGFPAVGFGVFFFVFCLILAVGVEVTIWGLQKLKYWAWIVGIVICALYVPSIFVVLGGLGLWGLLDSETQAAFQAARLRNR